MTRTWATRTQEVIHSPTMKRVPTEKGTQTRPTNASNAPVLPNNTPNKYHIQQDTRTDTQHTQESLDDPSSDLLYNSPNQSDYIQTTLLPSKENSLFGDLINTPKNEGDIRIFFQNVNSIWKFRRWDTLKEASQLLKRLNVDIVGFAETNLN
jgi:hypothetical protein